MKPIGALLGPIVEPEHMSPEYLLRLPSTDVLTAQLATAEALTRVIPEERERAIRFAERRLRWGEARDAIQARRPAGCWCLGAGGRVRRYVPGTERWVYDEYCGCADGERLRREHYAGLEVRTVPLDGNPQRVWFEQDAEVRRRAWLWGESGVPPKFAEYTLATFPATTKSAAAVSQIRRWVTNQHRPNLVIWGEFSRGKTGLACAALRLLVLERGLRGLFGTLAELLSSMREAMGQRDGQSADALLRAVCEVDALLLDDVGAEQLSEQWGQPQLWQVLNTRVTHRKRTIITTNYGRDALALHVGERISYRIFDFGHAGQESEVEVVRLDGPNLRAGHAA